MKSKKTSIKSVVYRFLFRKSLAIKRIVNDQILGIYSSSGKYRASSIFGYASKGLPGLEIIGLNKKNQVIREKLIYLGRYYQVKIPVRRYVLCVEDYCFEKGTVRWLELPLLVLYWKLAGILPIKKLENCFCGGKISTMGTVQIIPLEETFLDALDKKLGREQRKLNYLVSGFVRERTNIRLIPLKGLFGGALRIFNEC